MKYLSEMFNNEKWTNPNYDDLAWTWALSLTTTREAEWSEVKYCPGSRRSAQTPSAGPMICSLPASLARPHLSQCHCGYTELCSLHWGQVQGPGLGTGTAESQWVIVSVTRSSVSRSRGEVIMRLPWAPWSGPRWPPGLLAATRHVTSHNNNTLDTWTVSTDTQGILSPMNYGQQMCCYSMPYSYTLILPIFAIYQSISPKRRNGLVEKCMYFRYYLASV